MRRIYVCKDSSPGKIGVRMTLGVYNVNMNALILIGDLARKDKFIKEHIRGNDIPPYNVFEYQDSVKISDVREIKKILGSRSYAGKKRAFIFYFDPTVEAQNALLKTVEEQEDSSIIFASDHELLPTIISRCKIINLGVEPLKLGDNQNLETLIERLSQDQNVVMAILSFSDTVFSVKGGGLEEIILSLRKIILDAIRHNDKLKAKIALRALKVINGYSSTILSNNLNKRLIFERLLISEFAANLPS